MIRKATTEDLPAIVTLWEGEYAEEDVDIIGEKHSWYDSFKTAEAVVLGQVLGEMFVAEVDGEVVGIFLAHYTPFGGNVSTIICHEVAWYVNPAYRKRGLGHALVKAVEAEATRKGAKRMSLGVAITTPYHKILLEKYKKWGYVPFQTLSFKRLEGK